MILKLPNANIYPAEKHRASNSEKRDHNLQVEAWNYSGTWSLEGCDFQAEWPG
jgi:hypothetical protein